VNVRPTALHLAAVQWARGICDPDEFLEAWTSLTHIGFRSRIAGAFVSSNINRPHIKQRVAAAAHDLAHATHPDSELWTAFQSITAAEFDSCIGIVNRERWGIAERPRPLAPGIENIIFVAGSEIPAHSAVPAVVLVLVQDGDTWRVGGYTPSEGEIPTYLNVPCTAPRGPSS
jgi:hypothetical protein